MKNWILAHKVLSIVLASVLAVGIILAIVLPVAFNKPSGGGQDSEVTSEENGESGVESSEKQTYTITFDSVGGSAVAEITASAGDEITAPETPVKDGFVFDGWYESSDNGATLAEKPFGFTFMPARSMTLYAKWVAPTVVGKTYKVSGVTLSGTEEDKAAILDEYGMASEEQLVSMYKSTGFSVYFMDNAKVTVTFAMSEKPTSYSLYYAISETGVVSFYETAVDKENGVVYSDGLFAAEFVVTADCKTLTMTMNFEDSTAAISLICPLYNGGSAHTHTFDESKWVSDETDHWHAATCEHTSEKKDVAAHTWNDGEITAPATCTAEGEKTYTCVVCGYKKTEVVDKSEHTPSEKWSHNKDCHFHICTVCEKPIESSKVNHDVSLETYGLCKTCGFEDVVEPEYDEDKQEYFYETDFAVNDSIYLKVMPTTALDQEWRIDVEAQGCEEGEGYEVKVYDADGQELSGELEGGKTYYVVIICKANVNDAKITILDSNAM